METRKEQSSLKKCCPGILDVIFHIIIFGITVTLHFDYGLEGKTFAVPACGDTRYSFRYYNNEAIPLGALLFVCIALPIPLFFIFERFFQKKSSDEAVTGNSKAKKGKPAVFVSWNLVVGSIYSVFIVELIQSIWPVPTPYFWNACKKCNTGTMPFIIVFASCENDSDKARGAIKSFPSVHASLSVFSLIYLAGYLQAVMPSFHNSSLVFHPSSLFRKCILLLFTIFTTFACFTRLYEHRHHLEDVVGGIVIGAVVGLYMVVFATDKFKLIHHKSSTVLEKDDKNTAENIEVVA